MGTLLSYSLNVAIVLLPIYLIYKWLLAHETFHSFNRVIILSCYAIALLALPIISLFELLGQTTTANVTNFPIINISELPITQEKETSWLLIIILSAYLLGCTIMLIRSICIWTKIIHTIASGEKHTIDRGYILIITSNNKIAPFSWLKYVVMSRKDYQQAGEMIITHELQHLRCRHWLDMLIAEVTLIINWFNPAAWLMKEEMKTVHEYQADAAVLRSGIDARNYQILLIKKAVGARFPSLANSLNHSKLKKRITMMLSNQSRKSRRLRALAIVPAIAVALLVINQPSIAGTLSTISSSQLSISDNDKGSKNSSTKTIRTTAVVADKITIKSDTVIGTVNHFNFPKDSVKIILDDKEITQEEFSKLDANSIKNINIDKTSDKNIISISTKEGNTKSDKTIVIKTKKKDDNVTATNENRTTVYYINGQKSSEAEVKTLDASKVKSMEVKTANPVTAVHVTLK